MKENLASDSGDVLYSGTTVSIDGQSIKVKKVYSNYYVFLIVKNTFNELYSLSFVFIHGTGVKECLDNFFSEADTRDIFADNKSDNYIEWDKYIKEKVKCINANESYNINIIIMAIVLIGLILLYLVGAGGLFNSYSPSTASYVLSVIGTAWLCIILIIKHNIKIYEYNMNLYYKNLFNKELPHKNNDE